MEKLPWKLAYSYLGYGFFHICCKYLETFACSRYYMGMLWIFNITFLILNRVHEGYSFSLFGGWLAFLDNYRGTFRWHICFNLVVLRMISFGCDYHWSNKLTHFDQKKHMLRCHFCSSGRTCYHVLQERSMQNDKYSFNMYVCYLTYAPLYIAGPIVSFNAFATQLDAPQKNYSVGQISWYGLRWILSLLLMETVTHFFYYNAFAISGLWRQLSPFEIFIIGYGVLNFMWLKFFLIWRYFRFWSLVKSAAGMFIHRELSAVAGAVTITCLMVANLVGYVIGPSGINWLISRFLQKDGLPVLAVLFVSFYVATKLMFHIRDAEKNCQ